MDDLTKRPLSRRDALKALAGITGAAALSSLPSYAACPGALSGVGEGLPGKWSTPLVYVGALPAFAQCSPTATTAAFEVFNNTDGEMSVEVWDVSLHRTQIWLEPYDHGCIEGIIPGSGMLCFLITSGTCEDSTEHCSQPIDIQAGALYRVEIYCSVGDDGPSIRIN